MAFRSVAVFDALARHPGARRDQTSTGLFDAALHDHLAAQHRLRLLKYAVGQLWQALFRAHYADQLINAVVVRLYVGVRDRPVVAVSVVRGGFEIIIAQSQRDAAPDQRAPADRAGAHPT